MSRMSTFPRRPPSEQLCDLHVYKVPLDLWRAPLNNILNQSVTETVSLGIIRVPPDLTLLDIRSEIEKQLEDQAPKDYVFLRSVGRSITRVKTRQEYEWTAKHFLPPKHYAPELYLLEATPELRDALAISERSSQLSPISPPRASPGARSYRDGYRYGHRHPYHPDHGPGSPSRSPSPPRKGAGGSKNYRSGGATSNGYEREAAYTNNTNEDSGVAGMSPDNAYHKHRDRDSYYQDTDRSRDTNRQRHDEEEKRRQEERDRWAREQEERRRREEEEEQERRRRDRAKEEEDEENRRREEARRRAKDEEEEEERRRREEEEDRRRREEEDRRREDEKRRRREEEEEEDDAKRRREEEERRRREEEEEEERRRRRREEEEEEERRRRRREEEEERLKGGSSEDDKRYVSSPHSPSGDLDGQRDTESARQHRTEEHRRLLEELQEAKDSRQSTERSREELVKKAKTLQSKTQNRRNQARIHGSVEARDVWKKRYFEEKKKTPPLEDQTNRLREELDGLHRRMMAVLEGPREKNLRTGDNRPSQKNNYIIQCTRLQHDIDDMKRRVENAKMKLTAEMKLRTQAVSESRALREELTREKIRLTQARTEQYATLSPWFGSTPVPSIPSSKAPSEPQSPQHEP